MLIVQLTDPHICAAGAVSNQASPTNMLATRAFRAVAAMNPRPDAVLITGDLTENGLAAEYANFALLARDLSPLPVFVIPGNHDRRETLRAALAHLPGVTADPAYVQYAVEDHPVRLIMVDTIVPGAAHGELRPEQRDWLDRTLAEAPRKPTLLAMHHAPFDCGITHMDKVRLRDADALAAILARHRQVQRVVCGHHHRTMFTGFAGIVASVAPGMAHQIELRLDPGARGMWNFEPPAFHLHRWTEAGGFVTHTGFVENFPGPYPFVASPDYPGRA